MKHCAYQGHSWREKLAIERIPSVGNRMITVLVCDECGQSKYPEGEGEQ